jgi:D-alanine-D-alanine ligase
MDRRTGVLQILEINSLPGITPISDLTLCAEAEGWTHADLVAAVMDAAIRRHGLTPRPNPAVAAPQRRPVAQPALAH